MAHYFLVGHPRPMLQFFLASFQSNIRENNPIKKLNVTFMQYFGESSEARRYEVIPRNWRRDGVRQHWRNYTTLHFLRKKSGLSFCFWVL